MIAVSTESQAMKRHTCELVYALAAFLLLAGTVTICPAATILLKDGRILEGRVVKVAGVAEDPLHPKIQSGGVAVTPILLIDDGLRRTYVRNTQVREILEQSERKKIRIRIWQSVADHGASIAHVGAAVRVTPFDEFGRRIYELAGRDGPLRVVQGITEITPVYTKVVGLKVEGRPYVWDMRIATSSIPREALSNILHRAISQDDPDARLQIVRLYLQSERYGDARAELEQIVADFPEIEDREQELRQLVQMGARTVLQELQMRAEAGQHQLVGEYLQHFPSDDVAGETLLQVREMLAAYEDRDSQRQTCLERLEKEVKRVEDPVHRELAERFMQEIIAGLGEKTYGRLSSFVRLSDDATLTPEQKVALAISGWLVGTDNATDNFTVALSLTEVRDLVLEYLRSSEALRRAEILTELQDLEGATVERIADLLRLLGPPLLLPAGTEVGPGYYRLTAKGLPGMADTVFYVQLPPEYSSLRSYPTIVTLAGQGYSAETQLDFWAGAPRPDAPRFGQATRHGYITVAVDWRRPHQTSYEYSAREHHAVLGSLRHAMRHFAIDVDRVFLTGHGIGGDAAWDIALAHPDLWAGVIPFLAVGDRYCPRYWINAEYVPWYFVMGEKDGDKLVRNAREFDRYLRPNFDATVVELRGRGFEPFNDEIQRLFDWMNRRTRRALPPEFECATMRPWDNFFWWLEVEQMSPKTMVDPESWPPPRGARPSKLRGKLLSTNKVSVFAQAERTTVWLSPEMVDFDEQLTVEVNGRRISGRNRYVRPEVAVLLEDARTRGDRVHPFWAKLEHP